MFSLPVISALETKPKTKTMTISAIHLSVVFLNSHGARNSETTHLTSPSFSTFCIHHRSSTSQSSDQTSSEVPACTGVLSFGCQGRMSGKQEAHRDESEPRRPFLGSRHVRKARAGDEILSKSCALKIEGHPPAVSKLNE
jgi:hypothetical protein